MPSDRQIAIAGLALGLVVFLAGASAAVAVSAHPPTAFWAAGGAVSGGLLGLLLPSPQKPGADVPAALAHLQEAKGHLTPLQDQTPGGQATAGVLHAMDEATISLVSATPGLGAIDEAQAQLASLPPSTLQTQAQGALQNAKAALSPPAKAPDWVLAVGGWGPIALAGGFALLLSLAVVLAAGAITPPASFKTDSLQEVIKAVITLASAAGSGLIGLFAPSPAQSPEGALPS
jgi:hypothetical protein